LFTAMGGCLLSNENSYENAVEKSIKSFSMGTFFPTYNYD